MVGVVLAGCPPAHRAALPAPGGIEPGTWAIQLCQGPCSASENVVVEGYLVVESARYSADDLPSAARDYYRRYTALLLLGTAQGSPNACFALERKRPHPRTFAGIRTTGLTLVEPHEGDSVSIVLFQSPDASHSIVVKAAGRELRGRGVSWGFADAADDYHDDTVWSRRIGPPDRTHCIRAAEKAAAELQRPPPGS